MSAATVEGLFSTFNRKLDAPVRKHLKSVYAALAMSLLSASAGAYVHTFTTLLKGGGIATSLLGFGLAMWLHATPDDGKNRGARLGMLLGFAFLSGLGLGPLTEIAYRVNPAVIPNALLLTTAVFASFSAAAMFAPEGRYLYLGGTLMSALSALLWMGLANIFFQSQMLFQLHIWLTLLVFCGFVLWDTQVIILKKKRGDGDFISHALELFLDFVQIFRAIVVLLLQKEDRDQKNKKRRN